MIPRAQGFRLKVLQVAGGTAMAQGLLVLASPVLTRLYTPADFGVLVVYVAMLAILVILASLRYEYALPIPAGRRRGGRPAGGLPAPGGRHHLPGLAGAARHARTASWAGWARPALAPYLWLVPVSILGAGFYQVFNCWAIRKGGYRRIARTKVTQSLTQLTLQVGVGALVKGPLGLLVGDAVGRSNGTRTLAMLDWRGDWARLQPGAPGRDVAGDGALPPLPGHRQRHRPDERLQPARSRPCCWPSTSARRWRAASPWPSGCSPCPARSSANRWPRSTSASSPGGPEAGRGRPDGPVPRHRAAHVPPRACRSCSPPWPRAGSCSRWSSGADWREAGIFVVAIAPMALAQFTAACADSTLVVLERQDLALYREAVRTGLLLSGIVAAYLLKWPPRPRHLPVRRHRHPGLHHLRPDHLVRHPPAPAGGAGPGARPPSARLPGASSAPGGPAGLAAIFATRPRFLALAAFLFAGDLKADPRLGWIPVDLTLLTGAVLSGVLAVRFLRGARLPSRAGPALLGVWFLSFSPGPVPGGGLPYGLQKIATIFTFTLLSALAPLLLLEEDRDLVRAVNAMACFCLAITLGGLLGGGRRPRRPSGCRPSGPAPSPWAGPPGCCSPTPPWSWRATRPCPGSPSGSWPWRASPRCSPAPGGRSWPPWRCWPWCSAAGRMRLGRGLPRLLAAGGPFLAWCSPPPCPWRPRAPWRGWRPSSAASTGLRKPTG